MKDLVTVLFVLLLGGGGAAGFFYWKDQQRLAEERAYEQAIDVEIDSQIESFQLIPLLTTLNEHQGDRVALLRALYTDPIKRDRINLSFGSLQGDWPTSHGHLAEQFGRQTERDRFEAEIDERFGAGAYVLMRSEYTSFLVEERANPTAIDSQEETERQWANWAISNYIREHGRYPIGPIRLEGRRIVEEPVLSPAQ